MTTTVMVLNIAIILITTYIYIGCLYIYKHPFYSCELTQIFAWFWSSSFHTVTQDFISLSISKQLVTYCCKDESYVFGKIQNRLAF